MKFKVWARYRYGTTGASHSTQDSDTFLLRIWKQLNRIKTYENRLKIYFSHMKLKTVVLIKYKCLCKKKINLVIKLNVSKKL